MYRKNLNDGKNIDNNDAWTLIPAANGLMSVDVMFNQTGDYYVMCVGTAGSEQRALNFGRVKVVAVDVTPATKQQVLPTQNIAPIARVTPAGRKAGEWKYSTTLGSGYQSFPNANADSILSTNVAALGIENYGTYYVVFETTVDNVDNRVVVPVVVYSNAVEFEVVEQISVKDIIAKNSLLYPNPTEGNFIVNTAAASFAIEIIDAKGVVVYSKKYAQSAGIEQVSFAKKGAYIVKIITDKDVKISRLVVK
jgi:hypothetical protein